jgi:hypothetical protein
MIYLLPLEELRWYPQKRPDDRPSAERPNIISMLNATLFFDFVGVVVVLGILGLLAALLRSFKSRTGRSP